MVQLTQNPPEGIIPQLVWCIDWIYQLRNRLGSGGSGGSVSLPLNQIGVGTGTGITSFTTLIYDPTNQFNAFDATNFGIQADYGVHKSVFIGDVGLNNNQTLLAINDASNFVTVVGNKAISASPTPTSVDNNIGNSGINDLTNDTVTYTGIVSLTTYTITAAGIDIDPTPVDAFTWNDGGPESDPIRMTGGIPQSLSNGVEITFASDSAGSHHIGDSWTFTYIVAFGTMLSLDGQNKNWAFGDVDGITVSGLNLSLKTNGSATWEATIADNNGIYLDINQISNTYGIGNLDNITGLEGIGTYIQIDDNSGSITYGIGGTGSGIQVDIDLTGITAERNRVEPDKDGTYAMVSDIGGTISTPTYGTTVDLSAVTMTAGEVRDIEFNSSTGATGVLFPTGVSAAIGAMIIVSDLLAIANTSNIIVDAGIGNTLNSDTIAQTKVMSVAGTCWTWKKVTSTNWKLQ